MVDKLLLKLIVKRDVNMKLINDMTCAKSYNTLIGASYRQLNDKEFKELKKLRNSFNEEKLN